MKRTSILVVGLTLLAALMLVAAGCGGGKKNAAATTEAATTEATTTKATTTEAATTSSAIPGIASTKECQDLANLGQKFASAFSGTANSQDLKKEAALFKEFADKAPSDVRADFQVIAGYFSKIVGVVGNVKLGQTPDAETLAKLQKLSAEVDQTKLSQASQNIAAWASKNCHA